MPDNSEEVEKIGFFKKVIISLFKPEEYDRFFSEKFSKAIKYFLLCILIMALVIAGAYTFEYSKEMLTGINYFKNEFPNFTYEDGVLIAENTLEAYDDNYNVRLIVDTQENISEDTISSYEEKTTSDEYGIIVLREKIIISSYGTVIEYTYSDLIDYYLGLETTETEENDNVVITETAEVEETTSTNISEEENLVLQDDSEETDESVTIATENIIENSTEEIENIAAEEVVLALDETEVADDSETSIVVADVENETETTTTEETDASETEIDLSNKEAIVNLIDSSSVYQTLTIYAFIQYTIVYFIQLVIYLVAFLLVVIVFGKLAATFAKIRIPWSKVTILSVYALTLSNILYIIYAIFQLETGFTLEYFEIIYTSIACVYIFTAIFMIKSDFIEQRQEIEELVKVQKEIKDEDEDADEEKDKENTDEKEKNTDDKKEKKDDNPIINNEDKEPDGSEI